LVRGIDLLLRRAYGVCEFSQEEGCILRLALRRARADLTFSDGTAVRRGDLVGEFHLWNERLPRMGPDGADLAWARSFLERLVHSMSLLAAYVESDSRFDSVQAFRGEMAFALAHIETIERLAHGIGLDFMRPSGAASPWGRFAEFWESFYSCMLMWAFNPPSLRGKGLLQLRRYQVWISREKLRARYLPQGRGIA
jgi:hypothetical protein